MEKSSILCWNSELLTSEFRGLETGVGWGVLFVEWMNIKQVKKYRTPFLPTILLGFLG